MMCCKNNMYSLGDDISRDLNPTKVRIITRKAQPFGKENNQETHSTNCVIRLVHSCGGRWT